MQFGNIIGDYLNVNQFITSRIDTNFVNAKLVYADQTESVEVEGTNAVFKSIEQKTFTQNMDKLTIQKLDFLSLQMVRVRFLLSQINCKHQIFSLQIQH